MPGEAGRGAPPPPGANEDPLAGRLASHVQTLAGNIGERNLWNYAALRAAADYIEDTLVQLGYSPRSETYDCRGKPVRNIIAEKPGRSIPQEIVLVGAHYDSVSGSPGANDNGTGVAALLELARLLAERESRRTLRLVAFVNEEPPFSFSPEMGSVVNARAASERGDRILAMLALETIGCYSDRPGSQQYPFPLNLFYPDRANFIGFVGNLRSRRLVSQAVRSFRRHTRFPAEAAAVPAWVTGVGWSDHWSFWQAGYRALMVTDTAFYRYGHYHTAGDTPDKVDYERTARVVEGLEGVILDLAGAWQRVESPLYCANNGWRGKT